MPTTIPPAPVAAILIAILAVFHPVAIVVAVSIVAVPLPGSPAKRQTADTEDHQQAESYDFLYEHVSPFRDVNVV